MGLSIGWNVEIPHRPLVSSKLTKHQAFVTRRTVFDRIWYVLRLRAKYLIAFSLSTRLPVDGEPIDPERELRPPLALSSGTSNWRRERPYRLQFSGEARYVVETALLASRRHAK